MAMMLHLIFRWGKLGNTVLGIRFLAVIKLASEIRGKKKRT